MKVNVYSIGSVSRITGVTQKQLRNWESCGYIDPPTRITCGERHYRYYSNVDVDLIGLIKKYLDIGWRLSAASTKAKADLETKGGVNNEKNE